MPPDFFKKGEEYLHVANHNVGAKMVFDHIANGQIYGRWFDCYHNGDRVLHCDSASNWEHYEPVKEEPEVFDV